MQQIGIVLKHYTPKRQTIALLDRKLGRVYAIINSEQSLSAGSIISYQLDHRRNYYLLSQLELLDMPLALARNHMLFLHHLLELCYYFVPEGSMDDRIYRILQFVLIQTDLTRLQQKNLLCIFCALFGMYPEDARAVASFASAMEREPLSTIINRKIDTKIEKSMVQWLYQYIQMHSCARYFKTVHFLNEIQL